MKTLRKLAVIRNNTDTPCPFGLSITSACLIAGSSVDKMQEIEDMDNAKAQVLIEENNRILRQNSEQKQCKYAVHLFNNKPHVVDCNFGDTAAGLNKDVGFVGSPYYSQVGEGLGMGGLLTYPVSYQTDGSEYRNLYYGVGSWASDRHFRTILRHNLLQTLKIRKANNIV